MPSESAAKVNSPTSMPILLAISTAPAYLCRINVKVSFQFDVTYFGQINMAGLFKMVLLVRLWVDERAVMVPIFVMRIPGRAIEKSFKGIVQPLKTVLQNLGVNLFIFRRLFF